MKYRDLAPRLFDNGWRNVIPLTNGKAPVFKWGPIQHRDMTNETLAYLIRRFGDAPRVGMVFGPVRKLVAIDIDVLHLPTMDKIIAICCETLPDPKFVRVGNSPKSLLLYRGTVKSAKPHPIEIFGSSGQVAVLGPHPTANCDYTWINKSIIDHTPDDLDEVTQEQIDKFLARCREHVVPRDVMGQAIEWSDFSKLADERRMYGADAAARQVMNIKEGDRHNVLLSVVGWLVNDGHSPEEIAAFVDNLFPHHLRVKDRGGDWTNPAAHAAQMAHSAIEKWGGADWELKDD